MYFYFIPVVVRRSKSYCWMSNSSWMLITMRWMHRWYMFAENNHSGNVSSTKVVGVKIVFGGRVNIGAVTVVTVMGAIVVVVIITGASVVVTGRLCAVVTGADTVTGASVVVGASIVIETTVVGSSVVVGADVRTTDVTSTFTSSVFVSSSSGPNANQAAQAKRPMKQAERNLSDLFCMRFPFLVDPL